MPTIGVTPLFPAPTEPTPDIEQALETIGKVFDGLRPTITEIKQVVGDHYCIPTLDIDGPSRNMNVTFARHVFWWFARKFNGMSFPGIGQRSGGQDHTTVRHGVLRIERVILQSPLIAA